MQNQIHGPFGSFKLRPKSRSGRQLTGEPGSDNQARESMRHQLAELESERRQLRERFGCDSFNDVTRMIESLEAQLKDFYGRQAAGNASDHAPRSGSAASVIAERDAFLEEIGCESLEGALAMINSLRDQLHQLYAEGEARAAEQNLCEMYQQKQAFHERFGFSGVEETAAMISSMESQLRDFYSRQAA